MARKHPDLFHNRGTIYNYLEEYNNSISDYKTADEIDPTLEADKKIK